MQDTMPTLRGQRVLLRPFTAADVTDTYVAWLNDPLVVRFSNQRFSNHDRESCLRYLRSFADTDNLFISIDRLNDLRAIGTMTAYVARPHGTADVGILIGDTSVWGQGFGQDAWDTLAQWLLGARGIRKLTAGALACNAPMIRLMEQSGMKREATRKEQELLDGVPQDIVHYARFAGV